MFNRLKNLLKPFYKPGLNQVIFFITSKCNARCLNCFNWQSLNKDDDLSFDEIKKVSLGMPNFSVLLLSGGEPFLRSDLVDIVSLFHKQNKIGFVGMPTNGLLGPKILDTCQEILDKNSELEIAPYFALDGLEKSHDKTRGVPGNFKKCLESIKMLQPLKEKYKGRFTISLNTVISTNNINEISDFLEYLRKEKISDLIDSHYFELVRGNPRDPQVKNVSKEDLKKLYKNVILPYQHTVYQNRVGNKLLAWMARVNMNYLYSVQISNFLYNKKWDMPCLAGKSIAVLEAAGELKFCELRGSVGNLRQHNYDFKKLLSSPEAKKEFKEIACGQCFCTHGCFIIESAYRSPRALYFSIPWTYLKGKFFRK